MPDPRRPHLIDLELVRCFYCHIPMDVDAIRRGELDLPSCQGLPPRREIKATLKIDAMPAWLKSGKSI